jgi:hypothetical protein
LLRDRAIRRGAPLRLVPTRADGQLTLEGDRISTMTWFADLRVFPRFGLPRILSD